MRQLKITKSITNRESQSLDKYLQDIERLKLEKEAETQKTLFFQKETENYQNRVEELERAN